MTKLYNLLYVMFLAALVGFSGSNFIIHKPDPIGVTWQVYIGSAIFVSITLVYIIVRLAVEDVLTERKEKENDKK